MQTAILQLDMISLLNYNILILYCDIIKITFVLLPEIKQFVILKYFIPC
jgi:hypothetical protein